MAGPGTGALLWAGGFSIPFLEVGLALSVIEYGIAAYVVGRGFHGHRMRAWARRHGWSWEPNDRSGHLVSLQPAALAFVRKRHIRGVIRGDTPQGTFTLYLWRRGWRSGKRGSAGVCVMRAPYPAPDLFIRARTDKAGEDVNRARGDSADRYDVDLPDAGFASDVLGDDLHPFIAAHPELSWQWKGNDLVVTMRSLDGSAGLQELVRATDRFRALAPLTAPGTTPAFASRCPVA